LSVFWRGKEIALIDNLEKNAAFDAV